MGDGSDIDVWVARRLRELRDQRGITLMTLAEQTGFSAAHLSRLEKGERLPSIGSLLQLARVYGVSVSQLVEEQKDEDYHLVRASEAVSHGGQDGRYTVLSGPNTTIAVVQVDLVAGTRTKDARHAGEEWLHVQSGAVVLTVSGEQISLKSGDSVHFDSSRPHRLSNEGRRAATVLIASTAATAPMHHPIPPAARR